MRPAAKVWRQKDRGDDKSKERFHKLADYAVIREPYLPLQAVPLMPQR